MTPRRPSSRTLQNSISGLCSKRWVTVYEDLRPFQTFPHPLWTSEATPWCSSESGGQGMEITRVWALGRPKTLQSGSPKGRLRHCFSFLQIRVWPTLKGSEAGLQGIWLMIRVIFKEQGISHQVSIQTYIVTVFNCPRLFKLHKDMDYLFNF